MAESGTEHETTSEEQTNKAGKQSGLRSTRDEIDYLAQHFKGQCKVIEGTGRFPYTVKLNPEGLDIVFNFKLTERYPDEAPVTVVRSEALTEDELFDLTTFLTQMAESPEERLSLQQLVSTALDWLREGHISVKGGPLKKQTLKKSKNGKKQKKAKKTKEDEAKEVPKKPPMKTAIDVVKRILWDNALQKDNFLVGYIDRIDGLKEKYFIAFSWEDIASVDYNVLAIPKHRIQYFKYKDEIVWDKRCRLDNVFGSTGSKITIADVIRRIDNTNEAQAKATHSDGEEEINQEEPEHRESDYGSWSESDSDSDSDSDDGVTVTIGGATGGGMHYNNTDHDNDDDDDAGFDKYWRDRMRPNYFLALRMKDEEIKRVVKTVQEHIVHHEPKLAQCCIPTEALHITLCTVGLDTPEQVENAVKCLQRAKKELSSFVPKDKALKVSGVANFFHRVLYGKVEFTQEFIDLVEHLKLCLNEQGIDIRDYHEFVPHMSLMKISRPVAKSTGKKYISPWLYSSFNSTVFGHQLVDNIHLCEMGDARQDDGFYITATSLNI